MSNNKSSRWMYGKLAPLRDQVIRGELVAPEALAELRKMMVRAGLQFGALMIFGYSTLHFFFRHESPIKYLGHHMVMGLTSGVLFGLIMYGWGRWVLVKALSIAEKKTKGTD